MKFLCAILALSLVGSASAQEQPANAGKASVKVIGEFTADKDTTLNYVLKKAGKVVAEEKGLKALPGKAIEVAAADAAGPFELTVSATGGVLKVAKIGLSANGADGKSWEGMFGGRIHDLNAKDARGAIVRSVGFPITLTQTQDTTPTAPAGGGNAKNDSDKPTKDSKKSDGGNAKNNSGKGNDTKKKTDETKPKSDDPKLPVAPPPKLK